MNQRNYQHVVFDELKKVESNVHFRTTYYPDRISERFMEVRARVLQRFLPMKNFVSETLTNRPMRFRLKDD